MKTANIVAAVQILVLLAGAPAMAADSPQIDAPPAVSIPAPTADQNAPLKDPVESLNDAIKTYQAGKYSDALSSIDDAKKAIGAKRLAKFQALLPPAPGSQWTTKDSSDTLMLASVSREYTANNQTVSISYIVDPSMLKMMDGVTKLAKNLAAASGKTPASDEKSLIVKGYTAQYQESRFGSLVSYKLMIVTPTALVSVQSATITKDMLLKFANLVDFDKLKAAALE